ncbi:MAG: hypothetical protein R3B60_00350 [Candidatus Paceibacterota bacterium]
MFKIVRKIKSSFTIIQWLFLLALIGFLMTLGVEYLKYLDSI